MVGPEGGGATAAQDFADGTYHATYTITQAGLHQLVAARSGYDIDGSPFDIAIYPNVVHPPNCVVDGTNLGIVTPLVFTAFYVETFDAYGCVSI